jgi:hypothetical protein
MRSYVVVEVSGVEVEVNVSVRKWCVGTGRNDRVEKPIGEGVAWLTIMLKSKDIVLRMLKAVSDGEAHVAPALRATIGSVRGVEKAVSDGEAHVAPILQVVGRWCKWYVGGTVGKWIKRLGVERK